MSDVEKWKRVVKKIAPSKPDLDAHDGPCCSELDEETGYYFNSGCDCGNYDDAQGAGEWRSEVNRWVDFQKILDDEGLHL